MSARYVIPDPREIDRSGDPWGECIHLGAELAVELWIPGFRVRDLLALDVSSVVNTRWQEGVDVPLRVNGELIGWVEFEVVGERLAARITRLA